VRRRRHHRADPAVPARDPHRPAAQVQSAYRRAATAAGATPLLRQAYVDTPGHCVFSPGEQLAALHTLEDRVTTGRWDDTGPAALNARARAADPARYARHTPGPYPRPHDLAHPADRP